MKFTIKLNKEETEAFTNWKKVAKTEGMSDDDFYRGIFFGGVKAYNEFLSNTAAEMMERAKTDPELRKRLEEAQANMKVVGDIDESGMHIIGNKENTTEETPVGE